MLLKKLQAGVAKVIDENKETATVPDAAPGIKVCVRVRIFIKEELEGDRSGGKAECCIEMPTLSKVVMKRPTEDDRSFEFDRCYWSHSKDHPHYADQNTLQAELGEEMISNALEGFNNCIFAYGQTGSGKSYSVLGGPGEQRGLLPRIVESLFKRFETIKAAGFSFKTMVSFTEIYNEELRDLLTQDKDERKKLEVRQHPTQGIFIPNLTESAVDSCEAVMGLVEYGTQMRQVSATAMNATSSRSHCIFSFKTTVANPDGTSKMSQTHLVDLAGSERAGRTKATGDRLKEGANINKSLSSLARVISELAKKGKNPPFRDSKLTYVLKESLCGNSKTVMMAAISPNLIDYDETLSTMNFAQSVKKVQTKATKNEVNEKSMEEQLRKELDELREKYRELEERGPTTSGLGDRKSFASPFGNMRVSVVKKRLEEQEYLCKIHNTDWTSLLQEEKTRNKKRSGVDVEQLKLFQEKQQEQPPLVEEAHGDESDEEEEEEDRIQDLFTFCYLQKMEYHQTKLSLVGPIGADLLKTEGMDMLTRAEELSKQLEDCKDLAKEAETLVARHPSESRQNKFRISALVAISSDEMAPTAQVVICVENRNEWLLPDELESRVQYLRKMKSAAAAFGGIQAVDAWETASIEASTDMRARTAELKELREKAKRLASLEEKQKQEAAEREDLKSKLLEMQEQCKQEAAEKEDLRNKLLEVQACEKGQKTELDRLRQELAAATEEISRERRGAADVDAQLESTRSQAETAREELAKARQQLEQRTTDFQKEKKRLDEELSSARATAAAARERLATEEAAVEAARSLALATPAAATFAAGANTASPQAMSSLRAHEIAKFVAKSFQEAISTVEKVRMDMEQAGRAEKMVVELHGGGGAAGGVGDNGME